MTIDFSNEQEQTFDFDFLGVAEDVMEVVLDQEKCPYEAQISLVLTDDDTIHSTNREFRGIDRPTDVLSFPMIDFPAPADYSILEQDDSYFHPESGELLLGDIMISIPRAIEQAREYGHSLKREYAFLIAHSMLHLLGYDHMEENERLLMEQKQEQALQSLHIERK
ncbi:rRNA maturation RNase YbeY [bacterium]|nr:rRNA maturation RNase YbeY [bacterium]MDY3021613.1 rRNA maturation RNase YbeY [Oliverpabstia sp.]